MAFVGGAARSGSWCQILADVLDRPVSPLVDPDRAIARATGLFALARHGAIDDGALDTLVRLPRTYEPDPADQRVLAGVTEQFIAAFEALQPVYQALNP